MILHKLRAAEEPELGIISADHRRYGEYQSRLASVLTEEFGIFAVPQPPPRRKTSEPAGALNCADGNYGPGSYAHGQHQLIFRGVLARLLC
jgi:hypothetical protein